MKHLLSIEDLSVEDIDAIIRLAYQFKSEDLKANNAKSLNINFANKHILIVGDILHSRVARSNLQLIAKLGGKVTFVAPPTLLPSNLSAMPDVNIEYCFDRALNKCNYDAVMMLRIQAERMQGDFFPNLSEYINNYGLTNERFEIIDKCIPILHPAPVNRGLEISSEVVDSNQSLINHQISNGVYVRMAALSKLVSEGLRDLKGKTVVNLFFENSTRTRFSFETAEKKLGANIMNFSASGSSVAKGESLKDTVMTLYAMGINAIVMRHPHSGAAYRLASSNWVDVPVLNAGDGTHAHPTQALLDAMTLVEHFNNISSIHNSSNRYGK